jgi:hypothetical protein
MVMASVPFDDPCVFDSYGYKLAAIPGPPDLSRPYTEAGWNWNR